MTFEPTTLSPIVQAIRAAEKNTSGEIRVHLSKKIFEKDAFKRATKLLGQFGMDQAPQKNGVLIYVNLKCKQFAIVGDEGIQLKVGQKYWEELARSLSRDLNETHHERAIAQTVLKIGNTLAKYFPKSET